MLILWDASECEIFADEGRLNVTDFSTYSGLQSGCDALSVMHPCVPLPFKLILTCVSMVLGVEIVISVSSCTSYDEASFLKIGLPMLEWKPMLMFPSLKYHHTLQDK